MIDRPERVHHLHAYRQCYYTSLVKICDRSCRNQLSPGHRSLDNAADLPDPHSKYLYFDLCSMWLAIFIIGLACSGSRAAWHEDFGPWVIPTKGEIFPQVQYRHVEDRFFVLRPRTFEFHVTGNTCDIVSEAIERYYSIVMSEARLARKAAVSDPRLSVFQDPNMIGDLVALNIQLGNPCERVPYLNMNENYTLVMSAQEKTATLRASQVWGILRGLETFSQLVSASPEGLLTIKYQIIEDFPKFPHRGLLLDTSRHFIPLPDIHDTLDAMSYNKLNVFHWHIVDDNSFPYVSTTYPELSARGAYHRFMVYTPDNVRDIIEYARLRGIRVIPEFDTPAHTKSWGQSHPEILTECWEPGKPSGKLGPMNPTNPELWTFLNNLFTEVLGVFPDRYVHLGGDEILFDCWASNPNITSYMREHGIKNFEALEADYFSRLLRMVRSANVSSIVWQEVFSNVEDLSSEAVVQIWTGSWRSMMIDVLNKNHSAILSACWYLDALKSGGDWTKYYLCDPLSFDASPEMKSRVLGGEACMWSEFVDRTNLHSRIWPRASAAAERLWTHTKSATDEAGRRLEEHACRMNRRGISAQPPNGPSFCVV